MGFDELEQGSAERLGVEKGHSVPARTRAAHLVDERDAARVQALQDCVDVLRAHREVVQGVAALLEELFQSGVAAGSDQLQRCAVGEVEERRVHFLRGNVLLMRHFLTEDVLDQRDRRFHVLDADGGVIEARRGNSRGRRLRVLRSRLAGGQGADRLHHRTEGRLGPEHRRDAQRAQALVICRGNDSADDDRNVGLQLLQRFDQPLADAPVRAGEDRKADHVDVFLRRRRRDGGNARAQPRVHHLHAGIAQRRCDDPRAAVVAVEAWLSDEHADLPFHRSEPRRGLVGAELLLQRCRDLSHRAIRAHRIADARLQIARAGCRFGERAQRRLRLARITILLHASDARGGLARRLRRRAGDLHLRLVVRLAHRAELVDADDRHLALLHRPLVLVGALGDALLHVSAAQCLDEAAPLVDLRHHGADRFVHPVGERLDEPASPERIHRLRHFGLVGHDLLDSQRGTGGKLGGDGDRKSTRLNSSHVSISYAVFCLKKKKKKEESQNAKMTIKLSYQPKVSQSATYISINTSKYLLKYIYTTWSASHYVRNQL